MNYIPGINNSNEESTMQETGEVFESGATYENLTFKQKVERFIATLADKYDALMEKFLPIRIICCFTALCSTIAFIIMLVSPNSSGWIGFFWLIGFISALIACPIRILKVAVGLLIGGFTVGLAFFGIGCLVGTIIGAVAGYALVLYAPAIVTIPYCWKELLK